MASPAPPAETKKPATPPPAKDDKAAGGKVGSGAASEAGRQAPGKGGQEAAGPGKAGATGGKAAQGPAQAGVQGKPGGQAPAAASQQRFDRMAVRAKLAVSEPGDAVEREADAVAAKVMRMAEPIAGKGGAGAAPVNAPGRADEVRRKEEPKGKPASTQGGAAKSGSARAAAGPTAGHSDEQQPKKPEQAPAASGGPAQIQRKEASSATGTGAGQSAADRPGTTQELTERLGPGDPLDADTRAYFEKRMGVDLSEVRIHTDAAAAQAARQIDARAFTYGHHIAFASGAYQPQTDAGRFLLAHELAHVMQQSSGTVTRMIMRKKPASPTASSDEFEIKKNKLQIPPIKSRHSGAYAGLAKNGKLRRKGAYDAATRGTKQVSTWLGAAKPNINKIPAKRRPSAAAGWNLNLDVKGGAASKVIPAASEADLTRLLKIPTWDAKGSDIEYQVDHMVEFQLGGDDAIENMELLDQAHNGSVGSSFAHAITRVVNAEVRDDPDNVALQGLGKSPSAAKVMEERTVVFRGVEHKGRDSKRSEGVTAKDKVGASFWSLQEINALDHVLPMLGQEGDLKGTATSFALLSPTGNMLIGKFTHGSKETNIKVEESQSGGIAGLKISGIKLNAGYNDVAAGGNIGTLQGTLYFGPSVGIPKDQKTSVGISQATSPGSYSGKIGKDPGDGTPNVVEFKGMSPLELSDLSIGKSIYGKAMLKPSHPALDGLRIPAEIRDGRLGLYYSIDATSLASRLKIPGVSVDSASIDLGYDGEELSIGGGAEFTIKKFGTGFLAAQADTAGDFELKGGLRADTRLFDQADMQLWYRKKRGFGGSGTLAITQPGKIKGIKSATLKAKYEDSVFSADGSVMPDIPGLKAASLSVTYANDELVISGKLAIDDKVPGVQAADISVTVKQVDDGWKVAASGDVTPKLPALQGAKLKFSYDDGFVLMEGEFSIEKGPVSGKFKAGVTNGTVDDKGVRTEGGSGVKFSAFGAAEVDAIFIKDKLAGKLKLRLLPDGTVRVGGDLKVADFDVFPQIPKDGGEFLNKEISSPRIPLPGAGFSVGSMSVGVTFWASGHVKAHASVGPGRMTGITLTISEFDPANIDLNTLEVGGKAKFIVEGDAGLEVGADVNVGLSAAVVDLVGSLGISGEVGIPKKTPILTAATNFTYSQANGLNIGANCNLDISPSLTFKLKGGFSARLNLYVETVTIWKKDWTLAEANFKLPIGITANGALNYNSTTDKLSVDPASAIKIKTPEFGSDDFKRIVDGSPAPDKVENLDESGKPATGVPAAVRPKRDGDAVPDGTPGVVDENIVHRLGVGMPLDLSTRGYFEQRMRADLGRVLLHTGPAAGREAERLSARAFTVGEHIAFAPGEYQPDTPEGQELIAHELAHVAQAGGGGAPIVLRWPRVERTEARTHETPASVRAMSLGEFHGLTETQADWATSPALQSDPPALTQFRNLQSFADEPDVGSACSGMSMGNLIGAGIPGVYAPLRKYAQAASSGGTVWLRNTDDIPKARRWGTEVAMLEGIWSPANLSLAIGRPDPVSDPSPFEQLEDPAQPEVSNFATYLTACNPVLSASNGAEIESFLDLRRDGAMPTAYRGRVSHVRNYHHFTKDTLDGLVLNEAFPQWRQKWKLTRRPLSVVLYPSVDHNGAFHRNEGLEGMVQDNRILTIVVEGMATVTDYRTQLAPVAARYGVGGEIQQAMVGGHGNTDILVLAGQAAGAGITADSLETSGAGGTNTTDLMNELTRLMSSDPARRRIVLDACLTNSHLVQSAVRATPADAAADVNAAIASNPSLRDFVAGLAGPGASVFGSNSSFAPGDTTFMSPGTTNIGLSVPGDPDLIATKLNYIEFGTEPEGCMRALLECWAADQRDGVTRCRDAVLRRIGAGASTHVAVPHRSSWRESIIQPLYHLAAHDYWANGEALRRMGYLAGSLFELYWPNHTSATTLHNRLAVLAGNVAHVGRLLGSVGGDPHYAGNPRVAVVIEQAWMQHTPARWAHFVTALMRYGSCQEAAPDVDMALVMAHVPGLLTLPAPMPPAADQLRIALLVARHAPVASPPPRPLPAHVAFLRGLLGTRSTFPAAVGLGPALGGFGGETQVLEDIGRPLAETRPDETPAANVNLGRSDAPDRNDFRVDPLHRNGTVSTVRDDLMVRVRPTTASAALTHLPTSTPVFVIGEYRDWYAIEQPGRTGFVAKRYVTLVP